MFYYVRIFISNSWTWKNKIILFWWLFLLGISNLHVVNVLQVQLGFVEAELLECVDAELAESRRDFLEYVRINFIDTIAALVFNGFHEANGQGVIVDASARVQSRYDDGRFGNHVHPAQIVHRLTDIPTVYVFAQKITSISKSRKEIKIREK